MTNLKPEFHDNHILNFGNMIIYVNIYKYFGRQVFLYCRDHQRLNVLNIYVILSTGIVYCKRNIIHSVLKNLIIV